MNQSVPAWLHPTYRQIGTNLELSEYIKLLRAAAANHYYWVAENSGNLFSQLWRIEV